MTRFDWSLPYVSRRRPIVTRSIAATSTPLADQAGREMIRRGGNAAAAGADAIATGACMTVVEPAYNGIGSDAFSLAWRSREPHGLNGSVRSPVGLNAERTISTRSKISVHRRLRLFESTD